MTLRKLNLHLFDMADGGGDGGNAAGTAGVEGNAAPASENVDVRTIKYGIQPEDGDQQQDTTAQTEPETQVTSDTKEGRQQQFRQLMADYKDEFTEYFNQQFNRRHRDAELNKSKLEQYSKLDPVMDLLASKYGVDGRDIDALTKAIEEDDSYYEQEAEEKEMSVSQLKEMKRLQRENERFRTAQQQIERSRQNDAKLSDWMRQGDALKATYPDFNFESEISPDNPTSEQFVGLLMSNVDVKTAYEVIHHDQIRSGGYGLHRAEDPAAHCGQHPR